MTLIMRKSTTMQHSANDTSSITIQAPAEKVWAALTTPALIKQWFFGVDTLTDWKVGSPIVHKGAWNGKPYEDKGTILKFEPPNRLVHNHWSPMSGRPDRPESYQTVTYALSERNGATELSVTEDNFPSEEARALSQEIWKRVFSALKELVEE